MSTNVFSDETKLRRIISVHSLYGAGLFLAANDAKSRIKYPAFSLIFCDKGEANLSFSSKQLTLKSGECAFFPPNTEFTASVASKNVTMFYAVFSMKENSVSLFSGKPIAVSSFGKSLLIRLLKFCPLYFKTDKYNSISHLPERQEDCSPLTEQSIRLLLELFIIECIKPADKSIITQLRDDDTATESQKITSEIYAYLTEHTHDRISLADVADALYFSESYIKKAFRKETGKTIMQVFSELKIEEAKKLIAQGVPFGEISEKLSFCNKNYFTAVFKEVSGMTPSDYKKSL